MALFLMNLVVMSNYLRVIKIVMETNFLRKIWLVVLDT